MYLGTGLSTIESALKLVGALIVFILILMASYIVTKWIGKASLLKSGTSNIKVIETFRLSQNNFIQIVKIGTKYVALGISKEHIEVLTELGEDELDLFSPEHSQASSGANIDFKEVLSRITKKKDS